MGSTQTLLIAAVLLVLVASLPALVGARARAATLVYAATFVVGVTLLWFGFDRSRVLVDSFPSKILKYAARELDDTTERNVLVIDGGSYVLNGVDTEILTGELRKLGYSVRAVRMAVSAANHFERYRMQQGILRRVHQKVPRPGQHWVYLAEVQAGYDHHVLAQFADNQETTRAYHYLTISNAWYAARALGTAGVEVPFKGAWRWPLFRHTLSNAFNVGALQRYIPEDDLEFGGGRVNPRTVSSRFRFRGLKRLRKLARKPPPAGHLLPWLKDIRDKRTKRLWRPYLGDLVYFGVPSTTVDQLSYVREFCQATRAKCIAPADVELLEALDAKKFWRNAGHLSAKGAEIYTRWLAQELVRLGAVEK